MPNVSIIVPAYNVEKYIEKCLKSLVNQTLHDIEIIVVNDGSSDKTKEEILNFMEKYPDRIKYLEKENGGLSSARNYGMPYATGEYIAFLDSDDYVEKNMYEEMYNEAKKGDYDMVECDFIWEYTNKQKEDHGVLVKSKKELIIKNRVVAWNKLIKREILEKSKVQFPMGLRYEDVEFFYKLAPFLNKVSIINKCFVHYVQRENSIVNTQNSRTKEIFKVLENVLKYYKENQIYEEYEDELEYIYTRFLLCSSLKRMIKIKDKEERKDALLKTWKNLNTNFPDWQNNKILNENKSLKNIYMKFIGIIKKLNIIKIQNGLEGKRRNKESINIRKNFLQYLMGIYIIISPILDITSFIFRTKYKTAWSPTTFLRPIIPCTVFVYLFFKGKEKKKIIAISGIYGLYALIHICIFKSLWRESSYGGVKNELQYIVNYTFMILTLYVMYKVFEDKEKNILKQSVLIAILIYISSLYLAILTHTSSTTYLEGIGFKGWFESGNSLCTVLCIGLFIILTIDKDNKESIPVIITFILTATYLIVFSGMRTGILGVTIIGTIYICSKLLVHKSLEKKQINKKSIFIAILIFTIIILIIGNYGMQVLKRRVVLKENESKNIDPDTGLVRNVSGDILMLYKQIKNGELSDEYMSEEAQKSIVELYEYATKSNLSNVNLRKQQLMYNIFLVKNQKNPLLIIFGNGYKAQFRELVMEMEVPAIICNFGLIGFAIYLGPFIAIWIYSTYKLIKERDFDSQQILYISGIMLGLGLSTLAGYTFFNQSSMVMMCILSVLVLKKYE